MNKSNTLGKIYSVYLPINFGIDKLMSLSAYIDHVSKSLLSTPREKYNRILQYNEFLKQELELGMFCPIDETGSPIFEEPELSHYTDKTEDGNMEDYLYNKEKYNEALGKVLFNVEIAYRFGHQIIIDPSIIIGDIRNIDGKGHRLWFSAGYKTLSDLANDHQVLFRQ